MIVAPLLGLSLLVNVAASPLEESASAALHLTMQQKNAAMQPLMRSATECIARTVTADPRFAQARTNEVGDLIVDSMPACVAPVRAMIDAYDRYFGEGSGEAFFMGPYLDVLPKAVSNWVRDKAN
jgi:hypothetical protein